MAAGLTRWLVYSTVLFAGFSANLFCIPESSYWPCDSWRSGYIGYDSALVLNRLAAEAGPLDSLVVWNEESATAMPYRSQFGLQGVILNGTARMLRAEPDRFGTAAAAVFALLTALVLAAFATDVAHRFGPAGGNTVVLLLAGTIALMPFAASLYWTTFTLFAPFVLVWLTYPWAVNRRRSFVAWVVLVALLVGIKCLCGYEYVTTVVLGPTVAVTFHGVRTRAGFRRWGLHALWLTVAGCAGFGGALGIHIAQLSWIQGEDGLQIIQERATHRTGIVDPSRERQYAFLAPDPTGIPEPYREPARCFLNYFWQPALATPSTWGKAARAASLGSVCILLGALVLIIGWTRHRWPPETLGLAAAVCAGFVASLSWHMLAINHMCIHSHLNQIIFVVPFLLVSYALLGMLVQKGMECIGCAHCADSLAVIALLAIGGSNFLVMVDRNRTAASADQRAEHAVRAALATGQPIPTPSFPFSVDFAVTHTHIPHPGWDYAMSRGLTPTASGLAEPCVVAQGWAFDPARHKYGPSVRLVAVAGDKILPATAEYYRRADLDTQAGKRLPGAAFRVIVRVRDRGTAALRLLAVSGRDGNAVCELPLP